jgi:hypothetical protein
MFNFREHHVKTQPAASTSNQAHQPLVLQPVPLHPVLQPVHYQTIPINPLPQGATVQPVLHQQQMIPVNQYGVNYQKSSGLGHQQLQQPSVQQTVLGSATARPLQSSFSGVYSQQVPAAHPIHQPLNHRYHNITHNQPHMRSHWTDVNGSEEINVPSNDAHRQRIHHFGGNTESNAYGHTVLQRQQPSDDPNNVMPRNDNNIPIPAIYCEPTRYGGDSYWTQDGSFPGHNSALMTESRGVQNVPMMSTTGVQYSSDMSGNPWQLSADGSTNPQPLILTGRACPLCGASHYHAHVDSNTPVTLTGVNGIAQQPFHTTGSIPGVGQHLTSANGIHSVSQQPHYVVGSVPGSVQYGTSVNGMQPHSMTGLVPSVGNRVNGPYASAPQSQNVAGLVPSVGQHLTSINGFHAMAQQPHNVMGSVPGAAQQPHHVMGSVPGATQQPAFVTSHQNTT